MVIHPRNNVSLLTTLLLLRLFFERLLACEADDFQTEGLASRDSFTGRDRMFVTSEVDLPSPYPAVSKPSSVKGELFFVTQVIDAGNDCSST